MAKQIPLNVVRAITYDPKRFVLHSGVEDVLEEIIAGVSAGAKSVGACIVYGPARSGKTHLAMTVAAKLIDLGLFPRLVDGGEWKAILESGASPLEISSSSLFVVDDAEDYFQNQLPGNSGEFVRFFDELKLQGGKVVFFLGVELTQLPCDDHIISRLRSAEWREIGPPAEEDLAPLIDAIARQRGMTLEERKISFLAKRLGREIGLIEQCITDADLLSWDLGKKLSFPLLGDAIMKKW